MDENGKQFYLIPDGDGNWQRADPRIDRTRVERLTSVRGSQILRVIRLVKFWNRRATMPSLPSYLLENMILDYYENNECTIWPDLEFRDIVYFIQHAIHAKVFDPKGIQGDLNNVGFFDRLSIGIRCAQDHAKAIDARRFETDNDMKKSIAKWTEIFGPEFPSYG